jgi:hypothetical protein
MPPTGQRNTAPGCGPCAATRGIVLSAFSTPRRVAQNRFGPQAPSDAHENIRRRTAGSIFRSPNLGSSLPDRSRNPARGEGNTSMSAGERENKAVPGYLLTVIRSFLPAASTVPAAVGRRFSMNRRRGVLPASTVPAAVGRRFSINRRRESLPASTVLAAVGRRFSMNRRPGVLPASTVLAAVGRRFSMNRRRGVLPASTVLAAVGRRLSSTTPSWSTARVVPADHRFPSCPKSQVHGPWSSLRSQASSLILPFPVPRSPFPVPRSPFPVGRWTFDVRRFLHFCFSLHVSSLILPLSALRSLLSALRSPLSSFIPHPSSVPPCAQASDEPCPGRTAVLPPHSRSAICKADIGRTPFGQVIRGVRGVPSYPPAGSRGRAPIALSPPAPPPSVPVQFGARG